MGHVFDNRDAVAWERWYTSHKNRSLIDIRNRLLLEMLQPAEGDTLLDIGCGGGHFLDFLTSEKLELTGLEPSPHMIAIADKRLRHRVELRQGAAEDLPFEDNAFNRTSIVDALEFADNPDKALREACRVTRNRLVIGLRNSLGIGSMRHRISGMFNTSVYHRARFFSIWEVRQLLRAILGSAPMAWRTACRLPMVPRRLASRLEDHHLMRRNPFAGIAVLSVAPVPRFRTRPLSLKYAPRRTSGAVSGYGATFPDADSMTDAVHAPNS